MDTKHNELPIGLTKLSDVIGKAAKSRDDVGVGHIEEVVLDVPRNRVAYAVIGLNEALGGREQLYAVPWSSVLILPGNAGFAIRADRARLMNAPGFHHTQWPRMSDTAWSRAIHAYYREGSEPFLSDGPDGPEAVGGPMRDLRRTSDLVGARVRGTGDERLGKIEEIVIEAETGRIAYAVLSFGGFMGLGDKLFALPFSALTIPPAGDPSLPLVPKESLKNAPGFDKHAWPNMADPRWESGVRTFWSTPSTAASARRDSGASAATGYQE